jgi:hypothetical protein
MMHLPLGTVIPGPSPEVSVGAILLLAAIGAGAIVSVLVIRLEKDLERQRRRNAKWREARTRMSQQNRPYFATLKADIHPRTWLSKFSLVSIKHLILMSAFYHTVGIGLMVAGGSLIVLLDPSYEEPEIPVSLFPVLLAGPIEETLAFGIPTYLSSSPYVVLITGSLWALAHIFNTDDFGIGSLAYPTVIFAIPHIFLSLRLWSSGKGWFAVALHSGWNGGAFALACGAGDIPCDVIGSGEPASSELTWSAISMIVAEALLFVTYLLYVRRSKSELASHYRTTRLSIPTLAIAAAGSATGSQTSLVGRPSLLYYAAVIVAGLVSGYLGLIVGVAIFFVLRKRDHNMARLALLIGAALLGVSFLL